MENARETAMNAGVVEVGADNKLGAFPGRTERSYVGFKTGSVQVMGASFFDLAQEPKAPKNTDGPSTSPFWVGVNSREGRTDSKETRE